MQRDPDSVTAYFGEVELAKGADRRLDHAIVELKRDLANSNEFESRARRLVEQMAVILQASLLLRHGEQNVAEIFVDSRLVKGWGTFGTLQASPQLKSVIKRHRPRL